VDRVDAAPGPIVPGARKIKLSTSRMALWPSKLSGRSTTWRFEMVLDTSEFSVCTTGASAFIDTVSVAVPVERWTSAGETAKVKSMHSYLAC
jgi:hypothetical protein